jgi:hypothetical protein
MEGDACEPVEVPANAFLRASGDEWKCERGYRQLEDSCVALDVPSDAHVDFSGNDWTCNIGFSRLEGECVRTEQLSQLVPGAT